METQTHSKPRRFPTFRQWMHFIFNRRAIYALVVFITLFALFHAEENFRGKRAWDRYRKEAEARGVKLELTAFIPPSIPDEQNGAATPYIQAWFTQRKGFDNVYPDVAELGKPSGQMKIGKDPASGQRRMTDLNQWLTKLHGVSPEPGADRTAHARAVLQEFQEIDPLIDELRAASKKPHVVYPVEYKLDEPFSILLPHLARISQMTKLLNVRASAGLAANETDAAFQDVLLMFWLADSMRDEPFLINALVRFACLHITTQPIWEGIAQHKWSDAQLQQLTARLGQFDFVSDMQLPMDGERASAVATLDYMRRHKSFAFAFDWDEGPEKSKGSLARIAGSVVPRGWFYFESANYCRLMDAQTKDGFDAQKKTINAQQIDGNNRRMTEEWQHVWSAILSHRVIARGLLPAMENVWRKFALAQVSANEAALACALERYRLANGKLPETLDALAPKFMAKLPHDVLTGGPLNYQRVSDEEFVLSSTDWLASEANKKPGEWIWRSAP